MIGKSSTGKTPVVLADALDILEKRKGEGELGYEQKLAYDHIKKFVGTSKEAAKKMRKEIQELGISDGTAVRIINVMPIDIAQLKHILVKEKKMFEEEEVKRIMEVVESHRGK